MASGLGLAAIGLVLLAQVTASGSLAVVIGAFVVISLGLSPVFGLTTELIVGAAPPERAGAASGASETFFELGGALGISILGSIGATIYRGQIADTLPSGLSASVGVAARDTLGAATAVAQQLPGDLGTALITAARAAFVDGMQVAAAVSAVLAVGLAVVVLRTLGHLAPRSEQPTDEASSAEPRLADSESAPVMSPALCGPAAEA